jgi:DNA-binding CsgD family transcriptional regulator
MVISMSMRGSARLLRLIGLIYDAAAEPETWPACLETLREELRGQAVGFFPVVPGSLDTRASLTVGHEPEFLSRYDAHFGRPEVNAYIQGVTPDMLVPGTVLRAEAVVPDRELRRTEYFADWLRPQGIGAGGFAMLAGPGGSPLVLSIARSPTRGHLDHEEMATLRLLIPHLERALVVDQRLERLAEERRASESAIDLLDVAVVLLDHAGKPVHMNRRAHALLQANDGFGVNAEGLRGATAEATAMLRRCVSDAVRTGAGRGVGAGGAVVLPRPSGRRALSAMVTPIAPERWRTMPSTAFAAVLISDPDAIAAPPVTVLRRLWGLTGAEAVLAREMAAGHSLHDAAEHLGVTVATARSQLARVFAKTGTDRQADLMRMLVTALPQVRLS